MSNALKELSDALAGIVETTRPGIVRVEGRRRLPATGVVWAADGIIVTAHHVVERDEDLRIGLDSGDTVSAALIGRDPHNDIAILKVSETLTPVSWADGDDMRTGHFVLALGRPGNDVQATFGVVSAIVGKRHIEEFKAKREEHERETHEGHGRHRGGPRGRGRGGHRGPRSFRGWGRLLGDGYIQTDVVMYPGFSGGPLVSAYGTVYGLNTSGFSRGASLAVPVTSIQKSVATLLEHGRVRQGYLGVGVQPVRLPDNVSETLDRDAGVLVISIESDSPASQAGLLVGDIIVSVGDEAVEDVESLLDALTPELVGQAVTIQIVRGGQLQDVAVTVGERS